VLHLRGTCDPGQVRKLEALRRSDGVWIKPRRDGESGTGGRGRSHLISGEDGAGTRRVPQLSAAPANGLQRCHRMIAGQRHLYERNPGAPALLGGRHGRSRFEPAQDGEHRNAPERLREVVGHGRLTRHDPAF
jgi:hypothetical protein